MHGTLDGTVRTDVIDPYTPHSGDTRYRTLRYDLALEYRVATNRLSATATITAVAVDPGTADTAAIDLAAGTTTVTRDAAFDAVGGFTSLVSSSSPSSR